MFFDYLGGYLIIDVGVYDTKRLSSRARQRSSAYAYTSLAHIRLKIDSSFKNLSFPEPA